MTARSKNEQSLFAFLPVAEFYVARPALIKPILLEMCALPGHLLGKRRTALLLQIESRALRALSRFNREEV